MTVSRVINEASRVRAATRQRVQQAIARLDYVPNASARALAGERHYRLAFLFDNPSPFYLAELLLGLLEALSGQPHQLVVQRWTAGGGKAGLRAALRALAGRCEGVILPPPLSDDPQVQAALRAAHLPAVFLSGVDPRKAGVSIGIDDQAAARLMTEHLLQLGHLRIAFIRGAADQHCSEQRYRGYRDALAAAGVPLDPTLVVAGDFSFESGRAAATRLLRQRRRPTAIFASNDDMAAATLAVALGSGLRVPVDLSVAGFDDSPLAREVAPRLTTIRQPLGEMAAEAVRALVRMLDGTASAPVSASASAPTPPAERLLKPFELRMGSSTARVPRAAR